MLPCCTACIVHEVSLARVVLLFAIFMYVYMYVPSIIIVNHLSAVYSPGLSRISKQTARLFGDSLGLASKIKRAHTSCTYYYYCSMILRQSRIVSCRVVDRHTGYNGQAPCFRQQLTKHNALSTALFEAITIYTASADRRWGALGCHPCYILKHKVT